MAKDFLDPSKPVDQARHELRVAIQLLVSVDGKRASDLETAINDLIAQHVREALRSIRQKSA